LPRSVPGVDVVEWLVVDDGSTDETARIAREHGADYVVRLAENVGLAQAFAVGIDECLAHGADIIVNTDADGQYCADDIPGLIDPIVRGEADMVIGARPIGEMRHFSRVKRALQRLGTAVVRWASGTAVADAPSGFRALSRNAASQLHVFSTFSYTLETVIQAGRCGMAVKSVPVRVNPPTRSSRLARSTGHYLAKSVATILRIFMIYYPFRFFLLLAAVPFSFGFLIGLRFLFFFIAGEGGGRIQSLILASLLMIMGFSLFVTGLLAHLTAANRELLQRLESRLCELETGSRPHRALTTRACSAKRRSLVKEGQ
jgi:glycosyltransferase involved in cell wall biosynthesis